MPSVAGDPIFNADGTVSPTPQQRSLETGLFFAGLAAPGSAEVSVADKAADVTPQVAGKAGEAAAYLNQIRETYTINGRTRILDNIDKAGNIYESKNVAYLADTRQIKDFVAFAKQMSVNAYLTVRDTTKISAPLQQKIQNGEIKVLTFIRDELQKAVTTLTKNKQ